MLRALDAHFLRVAAHPELSGARRAVVEFLYFGAKQVRACLFVGLFFATVLLVPRAGLFGVPRYDLLLLVALAIQAWMLWTGLESRDEVKAITLFHFIGFALEVYKTSPAIGSWSYPDFGYDEPNRSPLQARGPTPSPEVC